MGLVPTDLTQGPVASCELAIFRGFKTDLVAGTNFSPYDKSHEFKPV